jgi:DMSO/TMAO reductase YedYZ molybdopterin-dependent catalytic subunit
MISSNDQTTNEALLNTLGEEQAAAWVRFYAIEADSRPGEHEYDRALAAARRLDAEVALIFAASGRPESA